MSNGNDSNEFPPGEGGMHPPPGGEVGGESTLNAGKPAVAAAPGKLIFVILFAGVFIFIIVKSLFFGEKQEVKEAPTHHKETVAAEGAKNQNELSITAGGGLPTLTPEMAAVNTPPPPPPPPPPPALIAPPDTELHANTPTNEALNKRIHSNMLVSSGGARGTVSEQIAKRRAAVASSNDPNSAFAQGLMEESRSERVVATKVGDLNNTILQGKLIEGVLETAIDSELPGPIRAITSHDTYAESGRNILIPKGSRIIGTYNSQLRRGQGRVFIVWQRVIRPDGVDIQIDSPGIDALGRAGMGGDVDNKNFEVFSAAILTSSLDIGVAALGDALFGNQQTTTTNNGSGSSTTSSPTSAAMQQSVTNIGNIGNNIVNSALNLSPEIFIDQGTPIVVFVNRDLIFPPGLTGNMQFVQ